MIVMTSIRAIPPSCELHVLILVLKSWMECSEVMATASKIIHVHATHKQEHHIKYNWTKPPFFGDWPVAQFGGQAFI